MFKDIGPMSVGKRALATREDVTKAKKVARKQARAKAEGRDLRPLSEIRRDYGFYLTGFTPGSPESHLAWVLIAGVSAEGDLLDVAAREVGLSPARLRKRLRKVTRRLRRLGYRRETVTRFRPPDDLRSAIDQYRCTRDHVEHKESDLPF